MRWMAKGWKTGATYGLAALALFVTAPGAAGQQAEELPSGQEVIDRFVEAIGGEQAILAQGPQTAKGRVEVPAQGIAGDMQIYQAPPNKMYTRIDFAGIGSIRAGYNGEVGWMIHPAMGPMILEGKMLDQTRHQADVAASLHPETLIAAVETVEKVDFEGEPCYKLKVTTRWDEEYFEYFSVATGLMVGAERSQASPMGEVPATTVVSDYQEFAGVRSPRKSVQRVMGMEQVITVLEVADMEPADTLFAIPEEIKALLEPAGQ
ncbi:MAG: hypothetical protein PVJ43_07335 [Gemmatimonadales bacterium]